MPGSRHDSALAASPAPRPRAGGRLPDFIAVGPPRTASTWLDRALRGHVGLPRNRKETDFFKRNYGRGLDWYQEYFRECPPDLPAGEVCPTYFPLAECRERIARDLPGVKVIVSLRDPVARAYSYYRLMRRTAWEKASFEDAVARRKDIADTNRYAFHLRAWQELFGAENVLVCIYDDLRGSAQAYVDRICDFIGAPRFPAGGLALGEENVNTVLRAPKNPQLARKARKLHMWLTDSQWIRTRDLLEKAGLWSFCAGRGEVFSPLDAGLEARLREQYRPEIEELERLIGRDLRAWKPSA
ncbi:MAG: sulfotransferase family protein [Candidatus Binataceae bacterium]